MNSKFYLFLCCMFLCTSLAFAQTIKVTGTVTDKMGPVIGATIMVKNSTNGTVTDIDGHYRLEASIGDILTFSFVGYNTVEKEVKSNNPMINVELTDDVQAIDEVVVTAIGIKQQKKKIGYTTQQINSDVLNATPSLNVGSALSGQVAGLLVANPTGIFQAPSFKLRGNTPLIVLDGVPVETDFFDISSENIESVNVLKGTAASALYGSRGKNGAILITSKTAKKEGLEINFSTNNMITAGFAVLPETQHQYGSGSNGKYEFWDGADGGISDGDMTWGPKLNVGTKVAQWNSPIRDKVTGKEIPWWGDVKGTQYDDKSRYERVPIDWVSHDNLKDFLQTGLVTNNNISIAYKGEKARYFVTGQYAYQKGQVPSTQMHSGGVNFNSTFDLAQNLQLDANLAYNKVVSPSYPRYGYGPKNHMYTIVVWMGDDVNGKELRKHKYVPGQEGYRQASYNYAWYNNPYFAAEELQQSENRDVVNGQLRLNYQLLPNLNIQGRAALRQKTILQEMKVPKTYMNYGDSREGDYKVWNDHQTNVDADVLATYTQDLTPDILFTLNAGSSVFYRNYRQEYQSTDGLIVPFVYSIKNTQGPSITDANRNEKSIRSIYGSVNLDLYKYAYLTLTGRNDWSSSLPSETRSYFYPSVASSVVLSQFIPMPKFIDFWKVRGAWTQTKSDLGVYDTNNTYSVSTDLWNGESAAYYPTSIRGVAVKPSATRSYEIGTAVHMFKNRLKVDFTYYNKLYYNLTRSAGISNSSGFTSTLINIDEEYVGRGVELTLSGDIIRTRDWNWESAFNWSRDRWYYTKIDPVYSTQKPWVAVGKRWDWYGIYDWERDPQGNIINYNGYPKQSDYQSVIGYEYPDWIWGWTNTITYKNFTLSFTLDGRVGGMAHSKTNQAMWNSGAHIDSDNQWRYDEVVNKKTNFVGTGVKVVSGSVDYDSNGKIIHDDRVFAPNDVQVSYESYMKSTNPYIGTVTRQNVFDETFFKLRDLSLSYQMPKSVCNKLHMKGLTLAFVGQNLFVWTKEFRFTDPDSDSDNLSSPSTRYLGFNVKLDF